MFAFTILVTPLFASVLTASCVRGKGESSGLVILSLVPVRAKLLDFGMTGKFFTAIVLPNGCIVIVLLTGNPSELTLDRPSAKAADWLAADCDVWAILGVIP